MREHQLISVRTRRILDVTVSRAAEAPFVAAASGLCELAGRLYVVADDEHTLASFPVDTDGPGARHLLLRPDATNYSALPKALKPDLEALCALPDGTLLALPSGSAPTRHLGAVIAPSTLATRILDFAALFSRLATETPELNLEGAAVIGDRLWLAQRGNNHNPSALFEIDLHALSRGDVPASAFLRAVPLSLGDVDGVPLTPTDLCPLPDGRLVVSAVCEDTADAWNDGPCVAAAIAILTPGGSVDRLDRLDPVFKVEGVIVRPHGMLWMCADADDPARPAPLLEGKL